MDFHSLSRRDLQALCKRNKIPANITNLAMADSLKDLDIVEGLEDVLNTEKTSVYSPAKTEIKQTAPRTSCRTSTRRKPIKDEPQTTQISTRTRGGTRRAIAGLDENNAAPTDMVRRKMESQLKEAADDEKKGAETPAPMATVSRRKMGTTSVRQTYSTRRSTRLLEKEMMGMNLDDDDDQVVQGDTQMVNELKSNEESVVFDKEMEAEGINQQEKLSDIVEKTHVSDEKPVVLLEDSVMGDNNEEDSLQVGLQQIAEAFDELEHHEDADAEFFAEKTDVSDKKPAALLEDIVMDDTNEEDSLKVQLQHISEAFDESKDHDADAEVFDENKGYLDSELTKIESDIDGPADGLVLENKEGFNATKELNIASFDQLEVDQEAHKTKENFWDEESLALDEIVTDFTNKDESEPEENTIIVVTQTREGKSKADTADGLVLENKEGVNATKELNIASFDQLEVDQEAHKTKENFWDEESLALDEIVTDFTNKDESEPEENTIIVVTQTREGKSKADTEDVVSFEKCDQISSWPVISIEHSEGKVGINKELSEIKSPKETEKVNNLPDINKENFAKENTEKVKKATTDMSIRQLRKILKQL